MSNKFTRYLTQSTGGPKGVLANFQHATDVFVENYYRLAPRTKFLYYAVFKIDPTVPQAPNLTSTKADQEVSLLIKTATLPSFTYDTVTKNAYNRKKVVYKQINYDPVTFTFHDDNAGIMNALWAAYYEYFGNDRAHDSKELWRHENYFAGVKYGMDVDTPVRFFEHISLYTMSRQRYNGYKFYGVRIKSWKHGDVDYSANEPVENSMTIEYEGVTYSTGSVSEGTPEGFASLAYDHLESPNSAGSTVGNSSDIFGSQDTDYLKGPPSFASNAISTINNYQNFNIKDPIANVSNSLSTASFSNAVSTVGGIPGTAFPKSSAASQLTIAPVKLITPPNPVDSFPQTFPGIGGLPPTGG